MSKKRRVIDPEEERLNKRRSITLFVENTETFGDVSVTLNGKMKDIQKYLKAFNELEQKVYEYEAKAKAFDKIYKKWHEGDHDDITFGFWMHEFMDKYDE